VTYFLTVHLLAVLVAFALAWQTRNAARRGERPEWLAPTSLPTHSGQPPTNIGVSNAYTNHFRRPQSRRMLRTVMGGGRVRIPPPLDDQLERVVRAYLGSDR
jgi:hypothetical protein